MELLITEKKPHQNREEAEVAAVALALALPLGGAHFTPLLAPAASSAAATAARRVTGWVRVHAGGVHVLPADATAAPHRVWAWGDLHRLSVRGTRVRCAACENRRDHAGLC